MMKLLHQKVLKGLFTLGLFLTAMVSLAQTTTYTWNCGTATASGTTTTPTGSANITMGSWSQGNNNGTTPLITTTSPSSSYTGSTGGDNFGAAARTGAIATGTNGSAYFQITITPDTGYNITISELTFGARSTSTGPQSYSIRSSANSYGTEIAGGSITNNSNWSLKTNSGLSITTSSAITLRIYGFAGTGSAGQSTANWRIDDLKIVATATSAVSSLSDIIKNASFNETENIDYKLYQATDISATNSIVVGSFDIRDGGTTTDSDSNGTTLNAITFSTANIGPIRRLAIYDGTTEKAEIAAPASGNVSFSSLGLATTDGGTKNFTLRATFDATVTDNTQFSFTVNSATAASGGSTFAAANAGAAATSTTSDRNRIEVTADRLAFVQQPTSANINAGMTPAVTVSANDANGNRDLDFTTGITLTSTGTLTAAPVTVNAANGLATFSGLTHTAAGNGLFLTAGNAVNSDWDTLNSTSFNINKLTQTITFGALANVSYGDPSFTLTATGGASGEPVTFTSDDETIATVSGNTVTIVGPGEVFIIASQAGNDNYNAAADADQILTVNKKELTITGAVAQSRAYDGTENAAIAGAALSGGIVGADEVILNTVTAEFDGKNIGTAKDVLVQFALAGAHASKYELAEDVLILNADITAKELTITGISAEDKDFDSDTDAVLLGSPVLNGVVGSENVVLDASGAIAIFDNMGPGGNIPVTVTGYAITGTDIANYTLTQPAGLSANILETGLDNQTITFGTPGAVTYGDSSFNLTATASSGLTVTYASSDENVATVTGNTVTITGAGTATITAYQLGDSEYNPAPAVPQELVVNKKTLTVAGAAVEDKIYNGGDVAVVTGTLAGIVGDDVVILNGTGQFASADVANAIAVETLYDITGADAGNYELTQPGSLTGNIVRAELTLAGADANDKIYDGTNGAVITGTLTGIVAGDTVSYTATGTFASVGVNAGITVTPTAVLEGPDAGNYYLTQPTGLTADITAKTLTVTATAQNKQYDGNTTAQIDVTAINGVVEGDDVTVTGGGTFANAAVANNKPVTAALALSGDDAANYALTQPTGITANITAMNLTVDVTNAVVADKVYDRTTANAVITGVVITGVAEGEDVQVTSGAFTSANVGFENNTVTPILSGTHAGNYTFTLVGTLTGQITPKEATITGAAVTTRTYDGTNAATVTGGSLQGVFAADVVAGVTLTRSGYFAPVNEADQGEDVGTGKAVTSTSTLTGAAAGNYVLVQPALTGTITAKALTVTGIAANGKVYDRTTAATVNIENAQLVGVVNDDQVSISGTPSAVFTNYNVGTRTVTVSGFTLAGNDAANYTLTAPAGLTAVITAKPITMTGGAVTTKTYNANTTAAVTGVTLVGVETGDTVTATTGTFASVNTGTHNVTVVLGGANAANYSLTQADPLLTGIITKKALTAKVTGSPITIAAGNAMPVFTIAYTGLVGSENGSVLTQQPTASVSITNTNTVGAYPITLTGGSDDNYEITNENGWLLIQNMQQENVAANPFAIWSNNVQGSPIDSTVNPFTAGQTYSSTYLSVPTGLGRGAGVSAASVNNRYSASGWWTGTSIGSTDYFSFRLAPLSDYQIDFTSLTGNWQSSSNGPKKYEIRSSIDNFTSTIASGTISASGNQSSMNIDLSALQNVSSATSNGIAGVEIRLYAFEASTESGTFSINDFVVTAHITEESGTPGTAPTITSTATVNVTFGSTAPYQVTAGGTPVITGYNAVGSNASGSTTTALPAGATVNTSTGVVSFDGTTPVGTHYIKVSATNYYGTGNRVVTYTVVPQPALSATPANINTFHAYQGQGASAAIQLTSITGSNLTPASGNISLSANGQFEVAIGEVGGYSSTGSFSYTSGAVNLTNPQIRVRMKAGLSIGDYTGTLTLSGGGATYDIALAGQVEAAPSITTTTSGFGPYCVGTQNNISVAYTTQGIFPSGNYYVQLSDAAGIFPTDFSGIISAPSATSPIAATLPNTMTTGNYRVRVLHLSSAPLLTFSLNDNGSDIQFKALPTLTGVQAGAVCAGNNATITLSGLLANTEVNVAYTLGGNAAAVTVTANAQGEASFDVPAVNGQVFEVNSITRTDGGSCAATFNSNNTATMVAYPTPTIASVEVFPACDGEATTIGLTGLLAGTTSTVTYKIGVEAPATAQVTADNNGDGAFELTFAPGLYEIEILEITNNATGCTNAAITGMVSPIVVNERPSAAIVSGDSAICLGNSTDIQIALTGPGTLMLTYTDGTATHGPVTVNQSEIIGGIYTLTVTPSEGVHAYSITALSNSECAAVPAGLTGAVTITATGNTWQGDAAGDTANWFNPENWSCGEVPSEVVDAYITEGTVTIADNQTAYASTVNVSGTGHLIVAAGSNLVVTGAVVADNETHIIAEGEEELYNGEVGERVIVGGQITIENTANLLQASNATNINSGLVSVQKESAPLFRLDYALWASPVTGESLIGFSPETLANRFYRYNPVSDSYNAVAATTQFEKGTGYLIRIPNNHQDYNAETNFLGQSWAGTFVGTPNNGNVTVNVDNAGFHAVGNPYPSPINIAAFYEANAANLPDDAALFFWRKKNGSDYSSYASLTLEGYTANGQIIENAAGEAIEYGDTSNGYFANPAQSDEWMLNPGQGFIVYSNGNDIVFNNDMRLAENRNQQFRNAQDETAAASRWWINISAVGGEFHQAMVSYSANGTLGIDFARDGKALTDGSVAIYSFAGETKLGIQARPSFEATDVVPMGYKASAAGTYNITVDHAEGVFAQGQVIFLRDNLLGTTHNLSEGTYSFTTEAGTFAGRFDIVYAEALGTDKPLLDPNTIIAYKKGEDISITSGTINMNGIKVYDLRGSLLYSNDKINATETVISGLQSQEQMLIIEVTTEKGKVSKKMIF